MENEEMFHQVTLDSEKVVVMRPLLVFHQKKAAEMSAMRAKNNASLMALYVQDELLKMLIVSVNGKKLSDLEKESFISRDISTMDYRQLMMVIEEMVGEASRPKVEMVSSKALSSVTTGSSPG